ncbi:MAG: GntR family transcriptional regulator [Planctomycetes bacterium]|nr:GntR family transcriptional regulator [Planctomycetota bacterium]
MAQSQQVKRAARLGMTGGRRLLYRSIADSLRRDLTSGKLVAGAKLPPVRSLARQFKVSVITISKALRALEREGHLTCIPAVGAFVPAMSTTSVAVSQITIAFATVELEATLTGRIAAGIEESCRQRDWLLQIHNAQADPQTEAETLSRLPKTGTSGAIILPVRDEPNIEALFWLKFNRFPYVLVDRRIPGLRVNVVESNHEQGGYLATRHLLEHGHRRVLMLTSRSGIFSSADDRVRGYERALTEAGIGPRPEWLIAFEHPHTVVTTHPWRLWYDRVMPTLKDLDRPTAILAVNASAGRGLLEACWDLDLRVPYDISVVSFGDTEFMEGYHPPVTVVAQRGHQIGQAAVELLERQLNDPESEPRHVLLDVDLIERHSIGRPGA